MSKDTQLVHARYLGGNTVVMPDLAGRPRCCDEKNHRENDPHAEPNPHMTLERGDVILLDRYSAENRDDFEVVDATPRKGRKTTAKKPRPTPASAPEVPEQSSDDAPAEPAPQED